MPGKKNLEIFDDFDFGPRVHRPGDLAPAVVVSRNGTGEFFLQSRCCKFTFVLRDFAQDSTWLTPGTQVIIWVASLPDEEGLQSVRIAHEYRRQEAERVWGKLNVGQRYLATVTNIDGPNTFVQIAVGVSGIIPPRLLNYGWTDDPKTVIRIGDSFCVKVNAVDYERQRVIFSRRACLPALPDPWETVSRRYQVGQVVEVVLTGRHPQGFWFAELEPNLVGTIGPEEALGFKVGEKIWVQISYIDFPRRRMRFSPAYFCDLRLDDDFNGPGVDFSDLKITPDSDETIELGNLILT